MRGNLRYVTFSLIGWESRTHTCVILNNGHSLPQSWNFQFPDSKVHGANMGPTWVLSAPDGPHVGPMNLAIRAGMTPVLRHKQQQSLWQLDILGTQRGHSLQLLRTPISRSVHGLMMQILQKWCCSCLTKMTNRWGHNFARVATFSMQDCSIFGSLEWWLYLGTFWQDFNYELVNPLWMGFCRLPPRLSRHRFQFRLRICELQRRRAVALTLEIPRDLTTSGRPYWIVCNL